jgi:hypothetical protein
MTLDGLLTIAVAAARERHPVASVIAVLALMAAIQLGLMLMVWFVIRRGEGGDDPGPGGGGPGGSRRRPPKPPPEGPVDWAEFERQFAEHVRASTAPGPAVSR